MGEPDGKLRQKQSPRHCRCISTVRRAPPGPRPQRGMGERARIDIAEQPLETLIPAELLRVGVPIPARSPAHIACTCRAIAAASSTGPSRPSPWGTRSIIAPLATPTTGKPDACASTIEMPKVSSAIPDT